MDGITKLFVAENLKTRDSRMPAHSILFGVPLYSVVRYICGMCHRIAHIHTHTHTRARKQKAL